jgi:hypothetical protein
MYIHTYMHTCIHTLIGKGSDGCIGTGSNKDQLTPVQVFLTPSQEEAVMNDLVMKQESRHDDGGTVHVFVCVCVCLCVFVCVYLCRDVCVYLFIFMCMYVHTYILTYIHTYIHTCSRHVQVRNIEARANEE